MKRLTASNGLLLGYRGNILCKRVSTASDRTEGVELEGFTRCNPSPSLHSTIINMTLVLTLGITNCNATLTCPVLVQVRRRQVSGIHPENRANKTIPYYSL